MKAATTMTRNVVTVSPSQTLRDAHEIMREWGIRHLPVIDGKELVGIISDRDILRHAKQETDDLVVPTLAIKEAMTRMPLTCSVSASVGRMTRLMLEHKIDSLPIVDEDSQLVGLVTSSDLLELLAEREELSLGRVLPFRYTVHRAGSDYAHCV